jgi:tetratricopeptide (TPR) repeat protein/TolB-like protein
MKKLLFSMTFTFFLFFFLFTTPCPAKQMNILVHPFENTGDKEYSWISAGMTDTVITDLTRIKNISVVSNQDRKKILEEMKFIFSGLVEEDKMIKLGKLTGANIIFTGSYLVSGSRIRVHARLVNVETGKVESSTNIDGTLNGIFDLQDKVIFTLMGETEKITIADINHVKLTEQDRKTIEEKPKPKLTAYELYAKGLKIKDTSPKEALTNFKKAVDIDPNYTDALISAGWTAGTTLNLFSEALGYLERAERIFKGRNETKSSDYAFLMMNIGNVYLSKGQLDRALDYYLNSQSIYDRLGLQNTAGYAGLMMNIGSVYGNKGQLDRALEYFLKVKFIEDRLGLQNTAGYANLMMSIGNVYLSKGQLDRALEYYLNSQSIYDRLGLQNTTNYAILMMNIGNVYLSKGQLDRALEYYLNSQSIYDRLGLQNTARYAGLMYCMAVLYEKQGQRDMAGRYYRMAYDTYVMSDYSGEWRDKALNNAKRLGY